MKIEKHIGELLFEHDCVILPDFGGFVCNYSSASVHSAKHRFHPPYKKITFNRNLRNNDGLLANQVAQSEEISYSDSVQIISKYVEKLNSELLSARRFDLKNIGTFYLGEEKNLLFEQDNTVNYLSDSFGLNTFYSPAIKREPLEKRVEKRLKDKTIVPSKEEKATIPAKRKISRSFAGAIAVIIIALLFWIPFQTEMFKNIDYSSLNPFSAKMQPHYKSSEIILPDEDVTTRQNVSSLIAMAKEKDTMRYLNIVIDGQIPIVVRLKDDATAVVKTNNRKAGDKKHFHVVGGAFTVPENAEKFRARLIQLGYNAIIVDKKGSHLRCVSYGGFATRGEALQALEKIRTVQSDVWLMMN